MRGTIIHWDQANGIGIISDVDGVRHDFSGGDLRGDVPVRAGLGADFLVAAGQATDIYVVPDPRPAVQMQSPEQQRATTLGTAALACGIMCFFLGPLGAFTGIPAIVLGVKGRRAARETSERNAGTFSLIGIILGSAMTVLSFLFVAFFVFMFLLLPHPPR